MMNAIMPTYGRIDVAFERGEGPWLYDDQGNRYLDALSGLGVIALGHANPAIAKTLAAQSQQLLHTSNLYRIPSQEKLAEKLASLTGMENMFFGNSGAEANECAIKIARLYGHQKGIEEPCIIVADASFHGRTMATLTATGNRKVQAGFEPLVGGFARVPYNDLESIEQIAKQMQNVVAVLVEPIQGEAGIQIPDEKYLIGIREICDTQGWLMMLDEVQSGNCRTGAYFCYQHSGIIPDLVTTAKGLGNGVPIGVCLASGAAAQVFGPGNHGSTFGGNPLSCAVALTVLDEFERLDIQKQVTAIGEHMLTQFSQRLGHLNVVRDVRGKGLMIGIELEHPCTDLVQKALQKGLLINVAADSIIRLLPPLIIDEQQADQICDIVCGLVEAL
ncbi:MAG: aspartate aminotransferase family protein [Pseudomonadota bacterium]|nr:aspartate aminotransferase family protein [Pseudomonadota bacterium]